MLDMYACIIIFFEIAKDITGSETVDPAGAPAAYEPGPVAT